MNSLTTTLETHLAAFINNTKSYAEGKINKLQLARSFDHDTVLDLVRDMKTNLGNLEEKSAELKSHFVHFVQEWVDITEMLVIESFPPIITAARIEKMPVFNEVV